MRSHRSSLAETAVTSASSVLQLAAAMAPNSPKSVLLITWPKKLRRSRNPPLAGSKQRLKRLKKPMRRPSRRLLSNRPKQSAMTNKGLALRPKGLRPPGAQAEEETVNEDL